MASTLTEHPVANLRSRPADTILLVEDDPHIARMYRFKLEYDGYRVHLAMTGETALALAFRSHVDLVLLDMGLPERAALRVPASPRRLLAPPDGDQTSSRNAAISPVSRSG